MPLLVNGAGTTADDKVLEAFVKFFLEMSLKEAFKDPTIALALLMIGQYNWIPVMERMMTNVLLAKSWRSFSIDAALQLYSFSELVSDLQKDKDEKRTWEMLKFKALWCLKRYVH